MCPTSDVGQSRNVAYLISQELLLEQWFVYYNDSSVLRYFSREIPSTFKLLRIIKTGSEVSRGMIIGRFRPFL